jgi:F0F1-type ATP synthase epsilon subunit
MAEESFDFKVYSGRGLEFAGSATLVTVKSAHGQVGFMARHCQYVATLGTGVAEFTSNAAGARKVVISEGFAKFSQGENTLTILADAVDLPEDQGARDIAAEIAALKAEIERLGSTNDLQLPLLATRLERLNSLAQIR